jgi:3-hydroxyisobutyrate dehydrogenase
LAVAALAEKGCRACATAQEAVSAADIVITMLPNDAAVEGLYLGASSVFPALKRGTLLIDCSTISVEATVRIAAAARGAGARMLDAPVSGGPHGAADASLCFMVGGDAADLARAEPLLRAMGNKIIHVGANGAGQAAKICNNMLAATIMAASAETLALGVRNGIDPAALTEVIQASSGGNTLLNRWHPWPGVRDEAPSTRDYAGGFQLRLMLKDLSLATANAEAFSAPIPLAALARSLYVLRATQSTEALGKDFSCIQEIYVPTQAAITPAPIIEHKRSE